VIAVPPNHDENSEKGKGTCSKEGRGQHTQPSSETGCTLIFFGVFSAKIPIQSK
jgi:hypothetical protein